MNNNTFYKNQIILPTYRNGLDADSISEFNVDYQATIPQPRKIRRNVFVYLPADLFFARF